MMVKIFLLLFFILGRVFSFDGFEYTLDVSKNDVVTHEPIILSLEIKQKRSKDVIEFDFSIPASESIRMELLESIKGRNNLKSRYLLYPLKVGDIEINPVLTVKRASKEELKKFVTGSADELRYLQTRNKTFNLKTFKIHVSSVDKDVVLIGDYNLSYHIDKRKLHSQEQVNLQYILNGEGYEPSIESLLGEVENADIFVDKEVSSSKLSHKIVFRYALHSNQDFIIPEVRIEGYNPTIKKRYTLKIPAMKILVAKSNEKALVVKEENFKFEWQQYLNYLLLFLTGYFTQKILENFRKKSLNNKENFIKKIEKSQSAKELLKVLLVHGTSEYQNELNHLELVCYYGRDIPLSKMKADILARYKSMEHDSLLLSIVS